MKPLILICCLVLVLVAPVARGWSDHATLLWPLVRDLPELNRATLRVESLEDFVAAEAPGLAVVLAEAESWSRQQLPNYPATPDALRFDPARGGDLRNQFLTALRINPDLPYKTYLQLTVDDPVPETGALYWDDLSFLSPGSDHVSVVYREVAPGSRVSPALVVATGSDEPDLGIDVGLYEDNGTTFGKRYGFGKQPFGDPKLDYGSKAPFHMGFYHLDWLVKTAKPDLLRTLPEWRIELYSRLAQFAFETGHHYWAWRFMGWSLHYIGDLTQPYHTVPLPGVSTVDALLLVAQGRTDEATQLVSNRHGVIESYQYERVASELAADNRDGDLLTAIRGRPSSYRFKTADVRGPLTAESVADAAALDNVLMQKVPPRFVLDPAFAWNGSGFESKVVSEIEAHSGDQGIAVLDAVLIRQLTRFSRYAHGWIGVGMDREASVPVPMPVSWSMVSELEPSGPFTSYVYGAEPAQQLFRVTDSDAGDARPVILIHGGCWSNQYDYRYMLPIAEHLSGLGFDAWVAEYRRVGDDGGTWPGIFEDIKRAITTVSAQTGMAPVLVGHSAGGHLALLAASVMPDSIHGVVGLAPITDLEVYGGESGSCQSMVAQLLEPLTKQQRAEVYGSASPARLPMTVATKLVFGAEDPIVGVSQHSNLAEGNNIDLEILEGAGHFDLVHQGTAAFDEWLSLMADFK